MRSMYLAVPRETRHVAGRRPTDGSFRRRDRLISLVGRCLLSPGVAARSIRLFRAPVSVPGADPGSVMWLSGLAVTAPDRRRLAWMAGPTPTPIATLTRLCRS